MCQKVVGPADVTAALPGRGLALGTNVLLRAPRRRPARDAARPARALLHRVEWSAASFYFTGDTDDTGELLRQRDLDAAFVSPWLLRAATKRGRRIDARRVVVYHHEKDESVPEIQGRELPRQGDELVFRKD